MNSISLTSTHKYLMWLSIIIIFYVTLIPSAFCGRSILERIELFEYTPGEEMRLGIGQLVDFKMVSPISAVTETENETDKWVLRRPDSKGNLQWPIDLLTLRGNPPELVIDPKLIGTYDIYVYVRAVKFHKDRQKINQSYSMAFQLGLDDGSQQEIVGANGFLNYHYDTEIFAAYHWDLSNKKLVITHLDKPAYLYGFRFVPVFPKKKIGGQKNTGYRKVSRWLASDHVVIAKDQTKHFAFPGVAKLKNGDIAVVYREGTIHNTEKIGKISLSRSADGGHTWLARKTVMDQPGDDRDPAIYQMSDGTVIVTSSGYIIKSKDFGYTWSKPSRTPVSSPHGVIEDEDGNIIFGGQETIQKKFSLIGSRKARLFACSVFHFQKGIWNRLGIATYSLYMPGTEDYLWQREPSLCVVPSRFYVMATTNRMQGDGFVRTIHSTDRGQTWESVNVTPIRGKPPHLLWLGDNRVLMSYGYRQEPMGVRACISYDYGRTWDIDNEIILRMDGGISENSQAKVANSDLGYPVSIQLNDNLIFTVYYLNKDGSNAFVGGTFWELPDERLQNILSN